jgi:hypothetical protein
MKNKMTLTEESYLLLKKLVEICKETSKNDKCYERIEKIKGMAKARWIRRHEKALYSEEKNKKPSNKAGRPKKKDKKIPIGIKLPPWLNDWMNRQPESKAALIETALINYYQIPEEVKNNKNS